MSDGMDETLLGDLQRIGLSHDESLVYLHLLRTKSATAAEIHGSSAFRKKKRPNLYKVLNRMVDRAYLHSEHKEGRALFFPVRPHVIIDRLLAEKRKELEELELRSPEVEMRLESIHAAETVSLDAIAPNIMGFVRSSMPSKWVVNERPSIQKLEGTVTQISIEFNTRRRFGGDAAGIVVFEFRYPNQIESMKERLIATLRDGMVDALENSKGGGPFDVKDYYFTRRETMPGLETLHLPYTLVTVHLNFMNLAGNGGFLVLRLQEYPSWVLGVWAASEDDLSALLMHLLERNTLK